MKYIELIVLIMISCQMRSSAMSASVHNFNITFDDTGTDLRNDVRFFLYTRNNLENPQQLWIDDMQVINQSLFNATKPTKFMAHGWKNTYQGLNCQTVRKAFLEQDDYNMIVVDWGNIAKLDYRESVRKIKAVGAYIAKMISFLESLGSNPNDMSLVGHSLGAHVMGLAGYQSTRKVGHVVGLDPAEPGFKSAGPGRGISPEDAQLVEIIHTNIGVMGLTRPAGHADFYPNGGGPTQPGCSPDPDYNCAHDRAYIYYAEAITRPDGLLAIRCPDYDSFLKNSSDCSEIVPFPNWSGAGKKPTGSYFLRTADKAPFGLGLEGTKPEKKLIHQ